MKRTRLLNSELSHEIGKIGHTASITLCDAGLPIPKGVKRIDLAIERGYPSLIRTLDVVLSEAIVRTGECTPYANVILRSGVVF
jgi:D-ribose pyranase